MNSINSSSHLPVAREGIAELDELIGFINTLGVTEECYKVNPAMVRGLEYYTGPIYETVVEEPKIGSITGGGRYDELIGSFSKQGFPATGTSFGIERIIDVMEEFDNVSVCCGENGNTGINDCF